MAALEARGNGLPDSKIGLMTLHSPYFSSQTSMMLEMELSSAIPPNLYTYRPLKEQHAKEHDSQFMGLISSTLLVMISKRSHLLVMTWLLRMPPSTQIYRLLKHIECEERPYLRFPHDMSVFLGKSYLQIFWLLLLPFRLPPTRQRSPLGVAIDLWNYGTWNVMSIQIAVKLVSPLSRFRKLRMFSSFWKKCKYFCELFYLKVFMPMMAFLGRLDALLVEDLLEIVDFLSSSLSRFLSLYLYLSFYLYLSLSLSRYLYLDYLYLDYLSRYQKSGSGYLSLCLVFSPNRFSQSEGAKLLVMFLRSQDRRSPLLVLLSTLMLFFDSISSVILGMTSLLPNSPQQASLDRNVTSFCSQPFSTWKFYLQSSFRFLTVMKLCFTLFSIFSLSSLTIVCAHSIKSEGLSNLCTSSLSSLMILLARSTSWNKSDCYDMSPTIFFFTVSSRLVKQDSTIRLVVQRISRTLASVFSNTKLISLMEPSFSDCSTFSSMLAILFMHWFRRVLKECISGWVRMLRWCAVWFSTHSGHRGFTQVIDEQKLVYISPSCSWHTSSVKPRLYLEAAQLEYLLLFIQI